MIVSFGYRPRVRRKAVGLITERYDGAEGGIPPWSRSGFAYGSCTVPAITGGHMIVGLSNTCQLVQRLVCVENSHVFYNGPTKSKGSR